MEVVEKHRHGFDIFPDDNRTVPFGTGATVVYNYKDLRIHNPSDKSYQMVFDVNEQTLSGSVYCNQSQPYSVEMEETDHEFFAKEGLTFRKNKVWRNWLDSAGKLVKRELMFENECECKYEFKIEEQA